MKVAIIGAGPAGLSAAYQLCKKGIAVEVFEAGDVVGGMAKTIPLWNQLVDLGPHRFFSSDPRVNKLWLEAVDGEYQMVNRLTRIYYKKTFFSYPLKAFNALFGLGLFEAAFCVLSYLKARIFPEKNEKTFEAWVVNRFGKRLFQIFFKSYSEKLWGISCAELDADFAAQRIKKFSLFEAIKSAILPQKKSQHKTLIDEFAYPKLGAGAAYEAMARKIMTMNGVINLKTPVRQVIPQIGEQKPQIILEDGRKIECDHVISSMPITLLLERMEHAPIAVKNHAKELKFRNTILIYLRVNEKNIFADQWLYIHSPNLKTGRITNFSNWLPSINQGQSETILCLEYWCYDHDEIWNFDEKKLVELAMNEICETTLVKRQSLVDGKVVRVPKCYPVYATNYKEHLNLVVEFLAQQPALSVIGRYGAFKYNNQDHSILMGMLAAENISENAKHDLWSVNTDYEYQESCRITATGLQVL